MKTVFCDKRKVLVCLLCLSVFFWAGASSGCAEETINIKKVYFSRLDGIVGVVLDNYLKRALIDAKKKKADIVIFGIDTPGGLVSSMRSMVKTILSSEIPIVMWVSPFGARAASAGSFLVVASHVAVMAEGTNIGAAHPITVSGKDIENKELNRKLTNDLASLIRSLAEARHRNADAISVMVTESVSYTAKEAMEAGVIDLIANDILSLISALDSRLVRVKEKDVKLKVEDLDKIEIIKAGMGFRERFLEIVSRPDIAYLLVMIGIYALIFEMLSPGFGVLGFLGISLIIMGAFGLHMLPVNIAGIILLIAGIGLVVLDLHFGSIILSVVGTVSIVVGALVIYKTPGGELLRYSMSVVVGVVVALTVFFIISLGAVIKTFRKPTVTGAEGLVGSVAVVVEDLNPTGLVKCHGEIWKAKLKDTHKKVTKGEKVRVESVDGLLLVVEPTDKS